MNGHDDRGCSLDHRLGAGADERMRTARTVHQTPSCNLECDLLMGGGCPHRHHSSWNVHTPSAHVYITTWHGAVHLTVGWQDCDQTHAPQVCGHNMYLVMTAIGCDSGNTISTDCNWMFFSSNGTVVTVMILIAAFACECYNNRA